jgi:protein SCO1/2
MMFWKNFLSRLSPMLGALALCAAGALAADDRGGDFTLNGPDGPLSLSDLRGKVVLIFFGYTSCPDVCPISLARIDAAFSELSNEERERVRALFITLDPERDTPDRLAKYTSYFNPNIIGLRGELASIDAVTSQYGVNYSKDPMPGSALGYSISHPTDILLLDAAGRMVESIPHDVGSKRLLVRIRGLLNASA